MLFVVNDMSEVSVHGAVGFTHPVTLLFHLTARAQWGRAPRPLACGGTSWRGPGCPFAVMWKEKSTCGRRTGQHSHVQRAVSRGRRHGGRTSTGSQLRLSEAEAGERPEVPGVRAAALLVTSRSFRVHVPVCLLHSD